MEVLYCQIKNFQVWSRKGIKIEVTGLRPCKKLFEELSLSEEAVNKTSNNKIYVFTPQKVSRLFGGTVLKSGNEMTHKEIQPNIDKLCGYAGNNEYIRAYEQMKVLIPSFKTIC